MLNAFLEVPHPISGIRNLAPADGAKVLLLGAQEG
jgi:hypothetical protein